ncbi:hypothetical protein FRI10_03120 [Salmonella enterica]|nr:hypothetical protein [Salmonella enterica]EEH0272099.1 hypothetical protein [Salmonella enterica]
MTLIPLRGKLPPQPVKVFSVFFPEKTMQLVTVVSRALYRLLPHDTCTSGEWITSHTGYFSFRAVVREDENGRFHAFVSKRTGYTARTFSYERVTDCGTFDTFRHAMSVAHHQACQLAHLRYAWEMA